ncbi:hypothetical protein AB0F13_23490 [Streptomyces sp. NPDC026206]|uniref:hypothetical protein n=1 Tax=Streptomyces sp. NPDC026206 TaxID=3157089 RepID=UPI0033C6E227
MPAAAALVAVAMSATAGCVSVSPHDDRSGPPRLSRAAEPEAGPGPARESLVTTGDDPARGRASLGRSSDPPLALTGDLSWGPSRNPAWKPAWGPAFGPSWDRQGTDRGAAGPADPTQPGVREPARPPRPAQRPQGGGRSAAPPPPASAPAYQEAHEAPAHRHDAPAPHAGRHAESRPRPGPESHGAAAAPEAPAPRGRKGSGVCALGDSYGKWEKGGDASRICHQVYGH